MPLLATFNTISTRDWAATGTSPDDIVALVVTIETIGNNIFFVNNDSNHSYNVDWGDGTANFNVSELISHQYSKGGRYDVSITGSNVGISFSIGGQPQNSNCVRDIKSWGNGNVTIGNADFMFGQCANLTSISATDSPTFLPNASMYGMFAYTGISNTDFTNWNTSNVSNMEAVFIYAYAFNGNVDTWNTSNVTNMKDMFNGSNLRAPCNLSGWNTSNVTNMEGMFANADGFNCNISGWNTSNVTNMSRMFNGAASFDQPIEIWNTSNVGNMGSMFNGARSFNRPIGNWDTSKVTSMNGMFTNAKSFNQDISNWKTGNVDGANTKSMGSMFANATAFNQNLSNWCVTNITTKPFNFDAGATAWTLANSRPVWGTCPNP